MSTAGIRLRAIEPEDLDFIYDIENDELFINACSKSFIDMPILGLEYDENKLGKGKDMVRRPSRLYHLFFTTMDMPSG